VHLEAAARAWYNANRNNAGYPYPCSQANGRQALIDAYLLDNPGKNPAQVKRAVSGILNYICGVRELQATNVAQGKVLGDQGSNANANERKTQYREDDVNKGRKSATQKALYDSEEQVARRQTPEEKAARKAYYDSVERLARRQTPEDKAARKAYYDSEAQVARREAYKERRAALQKILYDSLERVAYRQSADFKAACKARSQSADFKAACKARSDEAKAELLEINRGTPRSRVV
jgi:hypothetical protein